MTAVLQISCFVLAGVAYISAFLLFWIGLFPQDELSGLLTRWSVVTPFAAVAMPFLAFVVFVLGYDPRTKWLVFLRHYLLTCLQTTKALYLSLAVLTAINVIEGAMLIRSFSPPAAESMKPLLNSDFENAVKIAEAEESTQRSAKLIRLVADAEMLAKRRLSTSDSPTEAAALRNELAQFDGPFEPLWQRFLAQRGLAKVAFSRKDVDGMALHFTRAEGIARWIDAPGTEKQAHAAALFSLSRDENDPVKARELLDKAEKIAQSDPSIFGQRILGNIYYTKGDYGGAYRIWKALLDRDQNDVSRGLAMPEAIERKRLSNAIALARLKQSQPKYALEVVEAALKESWSSENEEHRTEQVRLLATKMLCLLALGRPDDALIVFEERLNVSRQLSGEGITPGSYLLKANVLSEKWKTMAANDPTRRQAAEEILRVLLLAQEPKRDLRAFKDYKRESFIGLVNDVATLWRWDGISFDKDGCIEAILSLLP